MGKNGGLIDEKKTQDPMQAMRRKQKQREKEKHKQEREAVRTQNQQNFYDRKRAEEKTQAVSKEDLYLQSNEQAKDYWSAIQSNFDRVRDGGEAMALSDFDAKRKAEQERAKREQERLAREEEERLKRERAEAVKNFKPKVTGSYSGFGGGMKHHKRPESSEFDPFDPSRDFSLKKQKREDPLEMRKEDGVDKKLEEKGTPAQVQSKPPPPKMQPPRPSGGIELCSSSAVAYKGTQFAPRSASSLPSAGALPTQASPSIPKASPAPTIQNPASAPSAQPSMRKKIIPAALRAKMAGKK